MVAGRAIPHSLKTASWERAEELGRFLSDCKSRNLNYSTLNKYRHLQGQLTAFAKENGYRNLVELDARAVRDFRNSWKLGPLTSAEELERLRFLPLLGRLRREISHCSDLQAVHETRVAPKHFLRLCLADRLGGWAIGAWSRKHFATA